MSSTSIRNQLTNLEKVSRELEPSAEERDQIRKKAITYSERFIDRIEKIPAFNKESSGDNRLRSYPIEENPLSPEIIFSILRDDVDYTALNPASGGHLGYIPGGGIYYSALGDYLADIFNRYAGISFAGAGAVRMENLLIEWVAEVMGYPKDCAGNLTSGGSIANLMSIVCARDASKIKSHDFDHAVIYMTKQVHHSVDKAIRIAGLKECIIRYVPMDDRYRMNADQLDYMIKLDKTSRLKLLMIIASAGTTDVGAVDPLEKIGQIAKKHEIWYHIDAAYGGFFMLTDEGKQKMKGIALMALEKSWGFNITSASIKHK